MTDIIGIVDYDPPMPDCSFVKLMLKLGTDK